MEDKYLVIIMDFEQNHRCPFIQMTNKSCLKTMKDVAKMRKLNLKILILCIYSLMPQQFLERKPE